MLGFVEWPGKEAGLEGCWHWDPRSRKERQGEELKPRQTMGKGRYRRGSGGDGGGYFLGSEIEGVRADFSEHSGLPSWLEEGLWPKQVF